MPPAIVGDLTLAQFRALHAEIAAEERRNNRRELIISRAAATDARGFETLLNAMG